MIKKKNRTVSKGLTGHTSQREEEKAAVTSHIYFSASQRLITIFLFLVHFLLHSLSLSGKQIGDHEPNAICFRPDGVAIFGLIVTFILIASTTLSVCSFIKMRRLRKMYSYQADNSSLYKTAMSFENLCYPASRRRF